MHYKLVERRLNHYRAQARSTDYAEELKRLNDVKQRSMEKLLAIPEDSLNIVKSIPFDPAFFR